MSQCSKQAFVNFVGVGLIWIASVLVGLVVIAVLELLVLVVQLELLVVLD